jgi:FkbM family methyltransferase
MEQQTSAGDLNHQGVELARERKLTEAVECFRRAIAAEPSFARAHRNLGNALLELGLPQQAIESYETALQHDPNSVETLNNLGMLRSQRKDQAGAIQLLSRAVELAPQYEPAWNNLGITLAAVHRHGQAVAAFRRALALSPESVQANNNLGLALIESGWPDEGLKYCERAIELMPNFADAHRNRGIALSDLGRLDEAIASYNRAMELDPQQTNAVLINRAKVYLLQGDYEAGWRDYENRLAKEENIRVRHEAPRWDGSPLAGRTLLLEAEQGMGDTIQFVRLAPEIKRRHEGKIILAVEPALLPLLAVVAGVDWLVPQSERRPKFDVWSPLLSIPGLLKYDPQDAAVDFPYLKANAERVAKWQKQLGGLSGVKVGLVWQGNRFNKLDRLRSFPLTALAPLAKLRGLTLVSLQKGLGAEQLDSFTALDIVPLGDDFDPPGAAFLDTAAVLKELDLVITVDTSVAHLAGAMGVRVWLALSSAPDWRWGLTGNRTPWYPSMRIFRQQKLRDWPGVFDQIATALREEFPRLRPRQPQDYTLATSGFNRLARTRHGPLVYNRHDAYIGKSLAELGQFSEGENELFRQIVRAGGTVVEAGANIGAHTIALAHLVGPAGVVHAIEPQRVVFQTLCGNVALNSLTNVQCHYAAVGDQAGTIVVPTFDFNKPNNFGGLSLGQHESGERVRQITIDSLGLARCDFLKIDVEGMELAAVRGASATLERLRPILYVENDREQHSAALIEALLALGYKLFWHLPRYFESANYYGNPNNVFGNLASINMLGVHSSVATDIHGLTPINGPDSDWRKAGASG